MMIFKFLLLSLSTLASIRAAAVIRSPNSYDYVIVGGGNAGLVVASRLTENRSISVMVLEAGHDYSVDKNITVPGLDLTVTYGSLVDWNYTTEPQVNLANRRVTYPRGYVLGGSSSTNFMAYTRGAAVVYDQWAAIGNKKWSWTDVLPYFKKSMHFNAPNKNQSFIVYDQSAYEPAPVARVELSYGGYVEPASILFVEALADASVGGHLSQKDINDGKPIGSGYLPLTIDPRNYTRDSSYSGFVAQQQLSSRPNLHIATGALATQILFDSKNRTLARGVEYRDAASGQQRQVYANREVVLSAGAFGSPQLLMLSGIGPSDELSANKIQQRVALPGVGKNLTDHLLFGPFYEVAANVSNSNQFLKNRTMFNILEQQYEQVPPRGEFTGAISSMSAYERVPDSALAAMPGGNRLQALDKTWPHVQLEVIAGGLPPNVTSGNFVNPAAVLLFPFSTGNVTLASNSPLDKPLVQPNWLSDATDRAVAVWAFKQVRQIWQSKVMQGSVLREAWPGANVTSDADILDAIAQIAHPIYQASSTCAMKPLRDAGVVDDHLRVYGTSNLRVIDNSITPIIPSANTMAVTYMIGEYGADLIKATW